MPKEQNFSLRHVREVLRILTENELVYEKIGAKYKIDPQLSAYQPTENFPTELALETLASVDMDYGEFVRVNKQENAPTSKERDIVKQDIKDLTIINNYLLNHSYPLKGPMTRIYSKNIGYAGRIYCEFQALSRRTVKIRQFSLLDEQPIAEVDIIASHPRMAFQEFYDINISTTFYQDIANILNIDRPKIKKFFQVALSSRSREKARMGFANNETKYDRKDFEDIERYVVTNYELLPLYRQWSQIAMNHEGSILKEVMLRGVDNDIPVLPIHDAVAVRVVDTSWAERALKEVWREHFGKNYCRTDTKVVDISSYSF